MSIAVIGGTGVYSLDSDQPVHRETVETPYGEARALLTRLGDRDVVFLPRHGEEHSIAPHRINYRANISALRQLGVSSILSTNAVGSLHPDMVPGDLVAIDQFIDLTKRRDATFFDSEDCEVRHVDMTEPYCPRLRRTLLQAAQAAAVPLRDGGTYLCAEGPRFETPAEIRTYRQWGADLVGMTNYPEVALAREAQMCYATICIVTNFAAGISPTPLSHQEVLDCMDASSAAVQRLILAAVAAEHDDGSCRCHEPIT
jgi:5'-methylthioadenosine phosphorylase